MPIAQSKINELQAELTSFLSKGKLLTDIQFGKYLREIKSHPLSEQSYLKAFAYGAKGDIDKAINHFEDALTSNNEVYANNYLAFLFNHRKFNEFYALIARLIEIFPDSIELHHKAVWSGQIYCDRDGVTRYSELLIRLLTGEQKVEAEQQYKDGIFSMDKFINFSGMSKIDLSILNETMRNIVTTYKVLLVSTSFYSLIGKDVNALIMSISTEDPEILSDMNFDLAFKLAEVSEFDGKKFSAWFEYNRELMCAC